jgi:short-subunit dehydrogenase
MGIVVVSGGASGIGMALGRAFSRQGSSVVLADVDEETLTPVVEDFKASGFNASGFHVDLRDPDAVSRLAEFALGRGTIETVCLNAGVSYSGPTIWETPRSIWDFVFGVNCFALVNQLASFVPILIRQNSPANIVITASMAGTVGLPTSAAYAASKAAAVSLAKSLRGELAMTAPFLKVALLNPGMVQTNLQRTSSGLQPAEVEVDQNFVETSHSTLNDFGASPTDVADWVIDALDAGRFWVFPPGEDPFLAMLTTEVAELGDALSGGPH